MNADVPELVDHLFRREAGRMVAVLTRILGAKNLALAEDAVQEALVRALEVWPFEGTPANPPAWLIQVAKHRALDKLRRQATAAAKAPSIDLACFGVAEPRLFDDDEVTLLFLCAHPALGKEARLALTLKLAGGFGTGEIARAFLKDEAAIAQRLVRAKRQIREEGLSFEMPPAKEVAARVESVLEVLYLIFNEGYGALRRDLCEEAIRLAKMVAGHPTVGCPEAAALVALFLLHSSRFDARLDASGTLLLMDAQDRGKWDRARIAEGLVWLARSASGPRMTRYHLEAGIAAAHASTDSAPDWSYVVDLYDDLYRMNPTPVVALNRAVALARRDGPLAGIEAMKAVGLENYFLKHAALGALWREQGEWDRAMECFEKALSLPSSEVERQFLERELRRRGKRALSLGEKG